MSGYFLFTKPPLPVISPFKLPMKWGMSAMSWLARLFRPVPKAPLSRAEEKRRRKALARGTKKGR